jgi:hypothetical protein
MINDISQTEHQKRSKLIDTKNNSIITDSLKNHHESDIVYNLLKSKRNIDKRTKSQS